MARSTTISKRPVGSLGANEGLIGKPRSRERLATPALILDLDAFEHNLEVMAAHAHAHRVSLRPHAKTHKSVRIAAHQIKRGAVGVCAATLHEAATMVRAGIRGVLITSPVVGEAKLDTLVKLLEIDPEVTVVVDTPACVQEMDKALRRAGRQMRVLIDIDVGMKRTGTPDAQGALALAGLVGSSNRLELRGLQCYSGMIQHVASYVKRSRVYRGQLEVLDAIITKLSAAGSVPGVISGGGTGTFDIDRKLGLFNESQAGSYVFMDAQYNAVELTDAARPVFKTSLFVQAMVVSNNHRGTATIDAGFKSFAMDGPVPVPVTGVPKKTTYRYFGDEFGLLSGSATRPQLPVGRKVEFVTPHCDPTVNLHSYYHCVRGEQLVDIWPVDARGTL